MIAILADTHVPRGTRLLPVRCLELLAESELIIHAGDLVDEGVLGELEALAPVVAVAGNMDASSLRERLPERAEVECEGISFGVVHDAGPAAGRHERLLGWFPGCSVIVYGHTHAPEVSRAGAAWVVNPGSPTERRRAPSHTMALVREGTPELVRL